MYFHCKFELISQVKIHDFSYGYRYIAKATNRATLRFCDVMTYKRLIGKHLGAAKKMVPEEEAHTIRCFAHGKLEVVAESAVGRENPKKFENPKNFEIQIMVNTRNFGWTIS